MKLLLKNQTTRQPLWSLSMSTFLVAFLIGLAVSCQSPRTNVETSPDNAKNLDRSQLPLVDLAAGEVEEQHVAKANKYMIAAQGTLSTQAGLEMFKQGGNIIDAAVAISFAIGVERPQSTGIGGGGFLLFYHPKKQKVYAYDFREMAPLRLEESMFLDPTGNPDHRKSQLGGLAVATPGLVHGLYLMHQRWGKLPWKQTLAAAIKMAKDGFTVYPELEFALTMYEKSIAQFPEAKKILFHPSENRPLKSGELIQQKDLAKTLEKIAKLGPNGFYRGEVAKNIVSSVDEYGGVLSLRDLKSYATKERTPIQGSFQGLDVFSMPPPSSGGIHVAQILNIVEELELNKNQNEFPWDAKNIHYTVSAMQQAFVDRTAHLGDPDFFPIPSKELTSKSYAAAIAETLQIDKFKNPDEVVAYGKQKTSPTKKDSTETTHFSIITEDGYAISSTQTINGGFGSHVVAKNTGVFLNNEIDDFGIKVGASNQFGAIGGEKNLIAPLKRPLSSMSPTIVVKAGRPVLALGSPNGTRIITCVAQTILNYHLYQLTLRDSVYLMRYHHQWRPNELWLEEGAFLQASIKDLKSKGHNLIRQNFPCRIQAVAMENKELIGVSDPRGRGLAQGL